MSDLDDKLKDIRVRLNHVVKGQNYIIEAPLSEDNIAQIKQSFADAGYLQSVRMGGKTLVMNGKDPLGYVVYYPDEVMTGQEWYERFEKQYHMSADWIAGDPEMGEDAEHDVLSAAKRAAGIEE